MTFYVDKISYDLVGRKVSVEIAERHRDGFIDTIVAVFELDVPPDTPEQLLRDRIEDQLRDILMRAADFVQEQPLP